MRGPRLRIAALMAVVVVLTADFAALRATLPLIPNPGLVLMVVVLEVGLFRVASRRGGTRPFWLGFEAIGWLYVLACLACDRPLWRLARRLYEGHALGRPIGRPAEMARLILLAGVVQLLLAAALATAGGVAAYRLSATRGPHEAASRLSGGQVSAPVAEVSAARHEAVMSMEGSRALGREGDMPRRVLELLLIACPLTTIACGRADREAPARGVPRGPPTPRAWRPRASSIVRRPAKSSESPTPTTGGGTAWSCCTSTRRG